MSMLDSIRQFFSGESGQRRREGLASLDSSAQEALRYYLGPTGIPDRVSALNQLLNPIVHGEAAGEDLMRAMDPALPPGERTEAGLGAVLNTASMGIPAIAAARGALTPAQAMLQTFGLPSVAPSRRGEDIEALLDYNRQARIRQNLIDRNWVPENANNLLLRPDRNYRYIGEAGYTDFLESGMIRARPTTADYEAAYFMSGRPSGFYARNGGDRYIVETPSGPDWRFDPKREYARPPRNLTGDDPIRIFELGPDGQYRVVFDNIGDTAFLP